MRLTLLGLMTTTAAPTPVRPVARKASPGLAFVLTFAALALGGVALMILPSVDQAVVRPFTGLLVDVCAVLLNAFGANVSSNGGVLAFVGAPGAVLVANGCNAVEVCLLLSAAILAWPTTIRARLIGVALCVAAVQAINLARIISLLFLSRYSPSLFDFFHHYVWDAVIVLDAVLVYFFWMRRYGALAGG